jgi:putative methionine-R-sulfoxide reductase with GAF domain
MYIRSVMAVPIFGRDGSVVGALELDSLTPHFFDEESKALGEAVAFLLSPFVQSAKVDS